MSILRPKQIPKRLADWLASDQPQPVAIPLLTVDDTGYPHVALLSWFEVLDCNGVVYFFLRAGSRTSQHLAKRPICLLFATPHFVFYLKGKAIPWREAKGHDVFGLDLAEVSEDLPHSEESGVAITSGIAFSDPPKLRDERLHLRVDLLDLIEGGGE